MKMEPPLPIKHPISINSSAGVKFTLMFLEPSLTLSRRPQKLLSVQWLSLCCSVAPFVYKMQLMHTRTMEGVLTKIQRGSWNIFFDICLYQHSLARASWAGCCSSVLNTTRSARACFSAFVFSKISSAHSTSCRRRSTTSLSS